MSRVPTPAQVRDDMVARLLRLKDGFLAFDCFEEAADMLEMANRLRDIKIAKKSKTTVAWEQPPVLTRDEYLAKLSEEARQSDSPAEVQETAREQHTQAIREMVNAAVPPAGPLVTTVDCPEGTKIILGGDVYEKQGEAYNDHAWRRVSEHSGSKEWCWLSDRAVYELYTRGAKFVFPPEKTEETKESV